MAVSFQHAEVGGRRCSREDAKLAKGHWLLGILTGFWVGLVMGGPGMCKDGSKLNAPPSIIGAVVAQTNSRQIGEGDGGLPRVGDFRVVWPGDRKLLIAGMLRP